MVCHEEVLDVAMLPCRHECLCRACAVRTVALHVQGKKSVQRCPLCRVPVESLLITNSSPQESQQQHPSDVAHSDMIPAVGAVAVSH